MLETYNFIWRNEEDCSLWINCCVLTHLHAVVATCPVFCSSGSCPGRETVWPEKCTLAAELTDDVLSLELGGHGLLLITGILSAAGTFWQCFTPCTTCSTNRKREPWGAMQLGRHGEVFFSSLARQLVAEAGTDKVVSVIVLQFPCHYTEDDAVPGYWWGGETEIFKIKTGKKGTVHSGVSLFLR